MKNLKLKYTFDKSIKAKGDPKIQSVKELTRYFKLILKLFKTQLSIDLSLLNKRIIDMYKDQSKRKNTRQVFVYLKEIYTLNNSLLSKGKYEPKIRISLDKEGRPRLLPIYVREVYLRNRLVFVAVQTILGCHRLLKWWPDVSYDTIMKPFDGLTSTLPYSILLQAKYNLLHNISFLPKTKSFSKKFSLKLEPIKGLVLESSGPNGKKSWYSVTTDAFAFYSEPIYLLNLVRFYILNKSFLILAGFIMILIIGLPLYLLTYSSKPLLGRLGVVYNVSGKARVIAMSNYWIQIALYPLHKSIFDLLKNIPTDGTFDQLAPVKELLSNDSYKGTYYSFDLSAATDRLPVELQRDVLSLFVGSKYASLWYKLIKIPFGSDRMLYSVGQPMGCYSSWAMLALTHHMVVNACISQPNPFYCVLGDDVIVTEEFSNNYLRIMNSLGLEISLSKSMISPDFVEFAKRVISKDGKFWSPIGPGLILNLVRDPLNLAVVLNEFVNFSIFSISESIEVLENQFSKKKYDLSFVLFCLFGPRGLINRNNHVALSSGMRWLSTKKFISSSDAEYMMQLGLHSLAVLKFRSNKDIAKQNLINFDSNNLYQFWLKFGKQARLHYALSWLSPTPWLSLVRAYNDYWEISLPTWSVKEVSKSVEYLKSLNIENLGTLSNVERANMRSSYNKVRKRFEFKCKEFSHLINNYD
uniref:RNA-dependent RNA polymerase n=1 Tax=Plasmopara viticola lesion associated mitovirus 46 TaxID=2719474 RepID=A0A6G9RTD9_9VIRU|nr:RNA-dependent RNA polymerase [Plasmopara viticola lesion associated mitovirus 46]